VPTRSAWPTATEDGSGSIRFFSKGEEQRLRAALGKRETIQRAARDSADDGAGPATMPNGDPHGAYTDDAPLNSEAVRVLERWQPAEAGAPDHVFAGASPDEPLTDMKKAWASLTERATLSAFRFHDLRHTFREQARDGRVDLNTVRELLGPATSPCPQIRASGARAQGECRGGPRVVALMLAQEVTATLRHHRNSGCVPDTGSRTRRPTTVRGRSLREGVVTQSSRRLRTGSRRHTRSAGNDAAPSATPTMPSTTQTTVRPSTAWTP
jgi:hypothetical protein